jgi:hypothetical protein
MNPRSLGTTKNITFKYNSFVNEELDKRKSHNDSKGEIIDNNLIKNNSNSDTESESTADSNNGPSYIEKYENCTKILTNLEKQCI